MTTPPPDLDAIHAALRQVIDPEAGMNIVDLGLIYRIERSTDAIEVDMTMTSPACPMGEMIIDEVKAALTKTLPEGTAITVKLVWSPPWDASRMSPEAKQHFGW